VDLVPALQRVDEVAADEPRCTRDQNSHGRHCSRYEECAVAPPSPARGH
jgi:hypothetical protein